MVTSDTLTPQTVCPAVHCLLLNNQLNVAKIINQFCYVKWSCYYCHIEGTYFNVNSSCPPKAKWFLLMTFLPSQFPFLFSTQPIVSNQALQTKSTSLYLNKSYLTFHWVWRVEGERRARGMLKLFTKADRTCKWGEARKELSNIPEMKTWSYLHGHDCHIYLQTDRGWLNNSVDVEQNLLQRLKIMVLKWFGHKGKLGVNTFGMNWQCVCKVLPRDSMR